MSGKHMVHTHMSTVVVGHAGGIPAEGAVLCEGTAKLHFTLVPGIH